MVLITLEEMRDQVIDNDVYMLLQSEPSSMERYASIVERKIFSYIDREQFLNNDENYSYPSDLKMVAILLLQSMYTFSIKDKGGLGKGPMKSHSRKHDDYAESYERATPDDALSFFGIPIDKNSLSILDRYIPVSDSTMYGLIDIDIH